MSLTFSIIKPDATKRNITGSINEVIEKNGLRIIAQKRIKMTNKLLHCIKYKPKEILIVL